MSDTAKLFALIDREAAAATNLKQAQNSYKEDNF